MGLIRMCCPVQPVSHRHLGACLGSRRLQGLWRERAFPHVPVILQFPLLCTCKNWFQISCSAE